MSVTVTKTATAAGCSERWTNFNPSFLQYWDSYFAKCALQANDAQKWGVAYGFGFAIPADATITQVSASCIWWGSHTGSYIWLYLDDTPCVYDAQKATGTWIGATIPVHGGITPALINGPNFSAAVYVGRTTGSAVTVYIDQIIVSVTYEPAYVAPPPPPPAPTYTPTVTTQAPSGILSNSATGNGTIVSNGGAAIRDYGFCVHQWPDSGEGTVGVGGDASSIGAYTLSLAGLIPGALYYVRAYAGNQNGYGYGGDVAFYAAPQHAGSGGPGIISALSGQSTGYAGGGAGGMYVRVGSGASSSQGGGFGGDCNWNGGAGTLNTGGGGGGAGENRAGGSGGSGIVVIRYKTADAIATAPSLSTSIFRPSLAYRGGRLFAPYSKGEDAKILTITGNTVASPTIITTSEAHGILASTAQVVVISGSVGSIPSIAGSHIATRVSDTTFSIPVNVTTAGTAGLLLYNHSVGWAFTAGGYNDVGWLTQSPTTFHTGTMKKDFRYVSVSHDVLPDGATVRPMSWLIDGVYSTADGVVYSPQETRFPINKQGYSIETTMGMTPDYTKSVSPIVRGVVVIWDFIKTPKHTYNLDCRKGAGNGKWKESPEAAIAALFQAADTRSTFEDRFNGAYTGIMDGIEFKQAARSLKEGPSGLVKITVREVE